MQIAPILAFLGGAVHKDHLRALQKNEHRVDQHVHRAVQRRLQLRTRLIQDAPVD